MYWILLFSIIWQVTSFADIYCVGQKAGLFLEV